MTTLSLPEELVLLGHDDSGTVLIATDDLDHSVAGAVLCDLAATGHLDLDVDGRVTAGGERAPDPLGTDPLLEATWHRIHAAARQPPEHWVTALAPGLVDRVLDTLTEAGLLRREQGRVPILRRTRYPTPDGTTPEPETEARQRLLTARRGNGPVGARTAALAGLLDALDALRILGHTDAQAAGTDTGTDGGAADWPQRCLARYPSVEWAVAATRTVLDERRGRIARGVFIATNVASGGS
ncbi:GPP34 family phosphoprotein [Solwaraspora sp. WMMA2056]|uniref:GOLPH3/VPS74 family protein n=1 Tax=Solwaraspora sp. WMMA2056 TaxID=3015161 RepID=UPI00259B67E6|nr:GPP34 family phosphoprotein [Solwaraspora sp. WMMA2056]WJK41654.1 GPP34 family phosphoprotein [Solwaraspora sp. WMMA2056]